MLERLARILRHRWNDDSAVRVFPPAVLDRLTQRVGASERRHTGQVRICVESALPTSYLWRGASARQRALTLFGKLRVWDTEHNNGVLLYLLVCERAIEVVADRGLARRVGEQEWQGMVSRMRGAFQAGRHEEGLAQAIDEVTALLSRHFPPVPGEPRTNELPDEPVLG